MSEETELEGEVVAVYADPSDLAVTSILIKSDDGKLTKYNIGDIPLENAKEVLSYKRVKIGTTNKDIIIDDVTIIEEVKSTSTIEEPTLQEH